MISSSNFYTHCLTVKGSEFSSYEIELRNRVTQNDVIFSVTDSKYFIEDFLSSYQLDLLEI